MDKPRMRCPKCKSASITTKPEGSSISKCDYCRYVGESSAFRRIYAAKKINKDLNDKTLSQGE